MGNQEQAEKYSLKAIEVLEPIKDDKEDYKKHLAFCYARIATVYKDMGNLEKMQNYNLKYQQIKEQQ